MILNSTVEIRKYKISITNNNFKYLEFEFQKR
jgi:hypothetical protein